MLLLPLCAQFMGPEPSLERAFRGHRGGVAALAFNPNMRQLVSAGLDNDVLVWNFKPSLRAYRFAGHTARGDARVMRACDVCMVGLLTSKHTRRAGERARCGLLRGERADCLGLQGPHRAPVAAHCVRARAARSGVVRLRSG